MPDEIYIDGTKRKIQTSRVIEGQVQPEQAKYMPTQIPAVTPQYPTTVIKKQLGKLHMVSLPSVTVDGDMRVVTIKTKGKVPTAYNIYQILLDFNFTDLNIEDAVDYFTIEISDKYITMNRPYTLAELTAQTNHNLIFQTLNYDIYNNRITLLVDFSNLPNAIQITDDFYITLTYNAVMTSTQQITCSPYLFFVKEV